LEGSGGDINGLLSWYLPEEAAENNKIFVRIADVLAVI
jgi:hypothetical protein